VIRRSPIFKIVIVDEEKNGIWEETYGSSELAEAFLQGLRAAFSFTDVSLANIPPIPRPIM